MKEMFELTSEMEKKKKIQETLVERIAKIEQNEAKKGNSERSEIDVEKSDTSSHKTDFLTRTNSRRQEGEGVASLGAGRS